MQTLRVMLIQTAGTDTREVDIVAADLDAGVQVAEEKMPAGWKLKSIRVFSDEPSIGKPWPVAV